MATSQKVPNMLSRESIKASLETRAVAAERNEILQALGVVQPEAATNLSDDLVYAFVETPTVYT